MCGNLCRLFSESVSPQDETETKNSSANKNIFDVGITMCILGVAFFTVGAILLYLRYECVFKVINARQQCRKKYNMISPTIWQTNIMIDM